LISAFVEEKFVREARESGLMTEIVRHSFAFPMTLNDNNLSGSFKDCASLFYRFLNKEPENIDHLIDRNFDNIEWLTLRDPISVSVILSYLSTTERGRKYIQDNRSKAMQILNFLLTAPRSNIQNLCAVTLNNIKANKAESYPTNTCYMSDDPYRYYVHIFYGMSAIYVTARNVLFARKLGVFKEIGYQKAMGPILIKILENMAVLIFTNEYDYLKDHAIFPKLLDNGADPYVLLPGLYALEIIPYYMMMRRNPFVIGPFILSIAFSLLAEGKMLFF